MPLLCGTPNKAGSERLRTLSTFTRNNLTTRQALQAIMKWKSGYFIHVVLQVHSVEGTVLIGAKIVIWPATIYVFEPVLDHLQKLDHKAMLD